MTLILPNDIVNDTPADAIPVDTNYKAITQYVNTNLVNRDGSVKMIGQLTLVGDPVQDNHAVRKAYVDAILPVGTMLPWLGVAAPAGKWALANGATLQNTSYPKLYNIIGHRYGGTGGSFKLPNMAGVVPVGTKAGDSYYQTLGNYGGSTKVPVPSHVHEMNHNHPSATTAKEAENHQHPIDHTHADTGTVADHTHPLSYLADAETAGAGAGARLATYVSTGLHTSTGPGGDHKHTVPKFDGNSGNQIVKHTHVFDVPLFDGDTKAYSLQVTDPDDRKSTTDFHAPFVVINYIVRLD